MIKTLVKELSMEEENFHLENLDLIQEALEHSIAAFAIQNEEDLFDEDNHIIIRKMEFSLGLKSFILIVSSSGHIRVIDSKMPRRLMLSIFEAIMNLILTSSESRFLLAAHQDQEAETHIVAE